VDFYSTQPNYPWLNTLVANCFISFIYNDYFVFSNDCQNYKLVNITDNFSVIHQGYFPSIKTLNFHYPYYVIVIDNNNNLYQVDV
jgi:hypothetical protein